MSRVIGFSGAHGTGKTTLLTALRDKHYKNVVVDLVSISRKVQATLNGQEATLASVVEDPANITVFQDSILREKALHLIRCIAESPQATTILTDRTPIDCYAYARIWSERHKFTGWETWLRTYWTMCVRDMSQYTSIVLLEPAEFNFVGEDQRASKETQAQHAAYCWDFIHSVPLHNVIVVTANSVSDRVAGLERRLLLT